MPTRIHSGLAEYSEAKSKVGVMAGLRSEYPRLVQTTKARPRPVLPRLLGTGPATSRAQRRRRRRRSIPWRRRSARLGATIPSHSQPGTAIDSGRTTMVSATSTISSIGSSAALGGIGLPLGSRPGRYRPFRYVRPARRARNFGSTPRRRHPLDLVVGASGGLLEIRRNSPAAPAKDQVRLHPLAPRVDCT